MEQIYYTQCPVGYGLGTGNGFQIKRLDPGYPVTGDFRLLSLRAFYPGTKTLAPRALRYRTDGKAAEVAWLTPRTHEYETEGGRLWGRPGGQFAHGLRLAEAEMAALRNWPAGLIGHPMWVEHDPEPTLGRPPGSFVLAPGPRFDPPDFTRVAPLAAEISETGLAALLTATARVVREGRTLFLIDRADRVADRVALLTFAFPEPMRPVLSFSTYHDRPEELPGFRIQGTTPEARPNRPALMGQGIVAEFHDVRPSLEPNVEPADWALRIARWFVRRTANDAREWSAACREFAGRVEFDRLGGDAWQDAWLDHLTRFEEDVRSPAPPVRVAAGWAAFRETGDWAAAAGLTQCWADSRGPAWWRMQVDAEPVGEEARQALQALLRLALAWSGGSRRATEWGEVVATVSAGLDAAGRWRLVSTVLRGLPSGSLTAPFVSALCRSLPDAEATAIIDQLKVCRGFPATVLLPIEAARLGQALRTGLDVEDRLSESLRLAVASRPAVATSVLEAVGAAIGDDPVAMPRFGRALAAALREEGAPGRQAAWLWSLDSARSTELLRPWLNDVLGDPDGDARRESLAAVTPDASRPRLAEAALAVAADSSPGGEAFGWCVRELLLAIPSDQRPHREWWSGAFVDRTSGLELAQRVFLQEGRDVELYRWIRDASRRGELSEEQRARLRRASDFAEMLRMRDAERLQAEALPDVRPEERGPLLARLMESLGTDDATLEVILEACARAWPGAFEVGAPGLAELAVPLASVLDGDAGDPPRWLRRLRRTLDRLGLGSTGQASFDPRGPASFITAEALRRPSTAQQAWKLRHFLLDHADAWKCLGEDARRDFRARDSALVPAVFALWDEELDKGSRADRFYELVLNACDGPGLAAVVEGKAADLFSIERISWWDRPEDAPDDIREAYARLVPMAPPAEDALVNIRRWMQRVGRELDGSNDLVPEDDAGKWLVMRVGTDLPFLSAVGNARWQCLEALATFRRGGTPMSERWGAVKGWYQRHLPLGKVPKDDRYAFLAGVIAGIEDYGDGDDFRVEPLARLATEAGAVDDARVKEWSGELAVVAHEDVIARAPFVRKLREEIKQAVLEQRETLRRMET